MTLFDVDSQYREKASIFRVFSLLPLRRSLLAGCVCRWFAVNIPLDLGTGGGYEGDIDIIACLKRWPNSLSPWPNSLSPWPPETPKSGAFYRTWEVKVAKLYKTGESRSLKRGKTRKILSQLALHRKFGSANVSLLDVYLCEAGVFAEGDAGLLQTVKESVYPRVPEFRSNGFGYQVLLFGHHRDEDDDVGLFTVRLGRGMMDSAADVLYPAVSQPRGPFTTLASRIDSFWESRHTRGPFQEMVVFCRACRCMQVVPTKSDYYECPGCCDDLVAQS